MERVLFVTGASSDMGMALIRKVHKEYDHILLQYRTESEDFLAMVKEVSNNTKTSLYQVDLLDNESLEEMISEIKASGILPNYIVHFPAPKYYNKQFHKDDWVNFESSFLIQVRSIAKILKAFIPEMSKNRFGRIIFMLSSVTDGPAPKYLSSYNTVKYALLGLMKSLSSEYSEKNVTVNAVSPDMVETKFLSEISDLVIESNRNKNASGKNVEIKDVVNAIEAFLNDNEGVHTGENKIILA